MRLSYRRLMSINGGSRGVSAGANWISTFRYGFEGSPVFGCYQEAPATNAGGNSTLASSSSFMMSNGSGGSRGGDALQRYVYCKALVYASCGGRLARDWIAGCASLSVSDAELVALALQHDASKDDLIRLQMILEKRRALGEQQRSGDETPEASAAPSSSSGVKSPIPEFFPVGFRTPSLAALSPGTNHPDDDDGGVSSLEQHLTPLTGGMADTVLRCFVYDAVKAASFHTASLLPEQVLHLEHVCATLGLAAPETATTTTTSSSSLPSSSGKHPKAAMSVRVTPVAFLQSVIDVVIEENAIMKEKFRVIEQQGSRQ